MRHNFDIRVISLNRAKKRKQVFKKNNEHIDFTFYPAIDGNKLTSIDFTNTKYFAQPQFQTKGAYGCAMSHINLWEICVNENKPLTIVEDDVIFRNDFYYQAKKVLDSVENYDIILWGFNLDSVVCLDIMPMVSPAFLKFSELSFRQCVNNFKTLTTNAYPNKLFWSLGIPAYTLSVKGAQFFLDNCLPLRSFLYDIAVVNMDYFNTEIIKLCSEENIGIDISMAKNWRNCNAYLSLPPLAISENYHDKSYIHPNNKRNLWYKT